MTRWTLLLSALLSAALVGCPAPSGDAPAAGPASAPAEAAAPAEPAAVAEEPAPVGAQATAKDPVCNMDVDPAKAAGTNVHEGVTYYFCGTHCVEAFAKDPAKYLAK